MRDKELISHCIYAYPPLVHREEKILRTTILTKTGIMNLFSMKIRIISCQSTQKHTLFHTSTKSRQLIQPTSPIFSQSQPFMAIQKLTLKQNQGPHLYH